MCVEIHTYWLPDLLRGRNDGRGSSWPRKVGAAQGAQIAGWVNLERFVDAQAPVYAQVRREMAAGRKQSHWMWFIFPQIAGLGQSPMSIRFAIASLDEAKAYLAPDPWAEAQGMRAAHARWRRQHGARDLRLERRDEVPPVPDPVRPGRVG